MISLHAAQIFVIEEISNHKRRGLSLQILRNPQISIPLSMPAPTRAREARVHNQPSNRANAALANGKSKAADDRRVVYKPVLENPCQIKWRVIYLLVRIMIVSKRR
jgi:hypothetical protein